MQLLDRRSTRRNLHSICVKVHLLMKLTKCILSPNFRGTPTHLLTLDVLYFIVGGKNNYKDVIFKVQERLQSWKSKLFSIGGRAVLIAHVPESMPIHLLSVVNPPPYVISELYRMFSIFYWSNSGNGRARKWASWDTICLPKDEDGLGFRSLHDVSKALFANL